MGGKQSICFDSKSNFDFKGDFLVIKKRDILKSSILCKSAKLNMLITLTVAPLQNLKTMN